MGCCYQKGLAEHYEQPIAPDAPATDVHKVVTEIITVDSSEDEVAPSVRDESDEADATDDSDE